MRKKQIICIITISLIFIFKNGFISIGQKQYNNDEIWINNIGDKDIKISINNIEIIKDNIKLKSNYDKYAVINLEVYNNSLDYIELSNINFNAYQYDKVLETFITSNDSEYLGFIGNLESGQCKKVKICVALNNKNIPLKLCFENKDGIKFKKKIKYVDL